MSSLAIKFLSIFLSIFSLFVYILFFNSISFINYNDRLLAVSKLTKLPSVSFSTIYVENRVAEYDDYSNNFYMGLDRSAYKGFVYAK